MTCFDKARDYEFTLEDELIDYDEVKRLYAAIDKLEPEEREIIERFYFLDQSLVEIACEGDKSYHQLAWAKKKVLAKLRSFMIEESKFR